jgi:hypothetical protein
MKHMGMGKTMGYQYEIPKNKDIEDFPAPNKYNILVPSTARNVINFNSKRSNM